MLRFARQRVGLAQQTPYRTPEGKSYFYDSQEQKWYIPDAHNILRETSDPRPEHERLNPIDLEQNSRIATNEANITREHELLQTLNQGFGELAHSEQGLETLGKELEGKIDLGGKTVMQMAGRLDNLESDYRESQDKSQQNETDMKKELTQVNLQVHELTQQISQLLTQMTDYERKKQSSTPTTAPPPATVHVTLHNKPGRSRKKR
tara:strand:- start:396 stop:1013 length:618 start_codon:yes stop_codon:yes gene_type:complete